MPSLQKKRATKRKRVAPTGNGKDYYSSPTNASVLPHTRILRPLLQHRLVILLAFGRVH